MRSIDPITLARHPEWLVIDIRPLDERRSELGFVPGSLGLPMVGLDDAASLLSQPKLAGDELVLFCSTGKRSGRLLEELVRALPVPIRHLEGGVLAWQTEGLPIARSDASLLDEHDRAIVDPLGFRRLLMSCFVAEATEIDTEDEDVIVGTDPVGVLRRCYAASGTEWDETRPERLYGVVDHASVVFRKLGGPIDRIALNMSRMYAVLDRIDAGHRS